MNRAAACYEQEQTQALLLNSEQAKAVETVVSQIGKTSKPFLLEGVSGSGKQKFIWQIIQEVLNMGKYYYVGSQISLTPQMIILSLVLARKQLFYTRAYQTVRSMINGEKLNVGRLR